MPQLDITTLTIRQFLNDHYDRRRDVTCLMRSQVKAGSRVWHVTEVLPGFPIDPDALHQTRIVFNYTDDFGRRKRGVWSTNTPDAFTLLVTPVTLPAPDSDLQSADIDDLSPLPAGGEGLGGGV